MMNSKEVKLAKIKLQNDLRQIITEKLDAFTAETSFHASDITINLQPVGTIDGHDRAVVVAVDILVML